MASVNTETDERTVTRTHLVPAIIGEEPYDHSIKERTQKPM